MTGSTGRLARRRRLAIGTDRGTIMRTLVRVLCLVTGIGLATPSNAQVNSAHSSNAWTVEGLTFSDELGGFRILDVRGRGSLDQPFVIIEEITGDGPAALTIRGLANGFGNRIKSHHLTGFALTKIVINRTEQNWPIFSIELQEVQGSASPFQDGLSFAQASPRFRPFLSDRYRQSRDVIEPFDGVSYRDGGVAPGEVVTLHMVITDNTPLNEFYLIQTRESPLSEYQHGLHYMLPEVSFDSRNYR